MTRFRKLPGLMVITQSGSTYLIPRAGKVVRLNHEASFVWKRLAAGTTVESAIAAYARHFDLPGSIASDEIRTFAASMQQTGYLVLST